MDVKGRTAIVFGGTSGIGLATSVKLMAMGASVTAVSRNPAKSDLPETLKTASVDVCDAAAVEAFFNDQPEIDILVNSATGGGRAIGPFAEMNVDGFKNSFAKLWGYSHVLRFGIDKMAEDGSIVLVSGTPARRCKPGLVALSAVGGAVEALVRAVAPEIAPIRLNVVSPGFIDTPMVSLSGAERVAHYEKLTKDHAIARAGTADEVADAILFAIQNDFVTGTTIDVDGGWLLS